MATYALPRIRKIILHCIGRISVATVLLLIFAFSSTGFGQQQLEGEIVKQGGTEILIGVSVINLNMQKGQYVGYGGNYKNDLLYIGDTILFSSAGYQLDTLVVRSYMFSGKLDCRS